MSGRKGLAQTAFREADGMDLRDRVVVVTGASSGIGRETARVFAQRGAVVIAVARREERLRSLVQELRDISPRSEYLVGDLGHRDFAERVIAQTVERHGRLDILVNNAALTKHKRIDRVSPEEAQRVFEVNTLACMWTTLAALPHMRRAASGCVVNVTSVAGEIVPPREAVYGASKAALAAFTEGLWSDLAGSGVHAALVVPGAIDTEIWEKLDEPHAFRGRKVPASRVADAIVEAVVKRRYRVTVPRTVAVALARFLHLFMPGLLRLGMRRMDPMEDERR